MRWKWYQLVCGAVLLVVAGGHLALRGSPRGPARPGATAYRPDQVAANGVVEGVRPEAAMRAEIIGTVDAIYFRENQQVEKGEILAELVNECHRQKVALAEAELATARADLEHLHNGERAEKRAALRANVEARRAVHQQTLKDWDRVQKMRDKQVASQEQIDAAHYHMLRAKAELDNAVGEHALVEAPPRQDDVAAAEGRVRAAEARCRLARAELAKTRLRAPTDGRVLRVYAEPGEMAGPRSAQPVLLFADLSRRRVRAFVDELDAPLIQIGQNAVVTCDGMPGQEFKGTVREVLPRMGKRNLKTDAPEEYKDVYFREVLIDLADDADLLLNLQVRVQIRLR
jgi:multidrug resistance efflux pump